MDNAEAPLDVRRLTRPEADAFRLIAAALGARFAGDATPAPAPPALAAANAESIARDAPPLRPAPRVDTPSADRKGAALLDRVPLPALVVDGEAIAFMNRAASVTLGYASAGLLVAAGGLGALFGRGATEEDPGAMRVTAANGATFAARVTMSAVDWGGGRAMLVTLEPLEATGASRDAPADDPLARLLDANPDPVALVDRAGRIEAYNAAFARLVPAEEVVRLDRRLSPGDLRDVLAAVRHAFCLVDGIAEPPEPVRIAGAPYRVSAGRLGDRTLACLVLHALRAEDRAATPAQPAKGGLERAVDDVRRLVDDAAVLVILDGAPRDDGAEATVSFWRSLILSVAARANVGSVLTVRHEDGTTMLRLAPRASAPLDRALASLRLAELAAAASLSLAAEGDALAVRPARQGPTGVARHDNLK